MVEFAQRRGMWPEAFFRCRCGANKVAARSFSAQREREVLTLSFVEVFSGALECCLPRPMIVDAFMFNGMPKRATSA